MTVGLFALVVLGGGLGGAARYALDVTLTAKLGERFPWGIFIVNASGSLALGLLVGLASSSHLSTSWLTVLGTGVLGGYTTFSTAMVDAVLLLQKRRVTASALNALGMVAVTVALAVGGIALGGGI